MVLHSSRRRSPSDTHKMVFLVDRFRPRKKVHRGIIHGVKPLVGTSAIEVLRLSLSRWFQVLGVDSGDESLDVHFMLLLQRIRMKNRFKFDWVPFSTDDTSESGKISRSLKSLPLSIINRQGLGVSDLFPSP